MRMKTVWFDGLVVWQSASISWTRSIQNLASVALFLAALLPEVHAATYYVATIGNNTNPGSAGSPWRTIQKAATTMVAGDTVVVAAGTYDEKVTTMANGTAENPIRFTTSGSVTSGGFVVTRAYQEIIGFTLNGTNVGVYKGLVDIQNGGHHLTVRSNTLSTAILGQWLIRFDPALANRILTNCIIADNQFLGTAYMGIGLGGSGHQVTNNYFHSEYRNQTNNLADRDAFRIYADNVIIAGNTFTNWTQVNSGPGHADLFQSYAAKSSTNVLIERNFAINCEGLQIGNVDSNGTNLSTHHWTFRNNIFANVGQALNLGCSDASFYNNVFYRCTQNTGNPLIFFCEIPGMGYAHNARVFNNIFFECGSAVSYASCGWYQFKSGTTNMLADYNLVIGTGTGTTKTGFVTATCELNSLNGVNPLFVNSAAGTPAGFALQANSPCIGAGTNLDALFTTDFAGVTRGAVWDIGAFRLRPLPPSALRVIP